MSGVVACVANDKCRHRTDQPHATCYRSPGEVTHERPLWPVHPSPDSASGQALTLSSHGRIRDLLVDGFRVVRQSSGYDVGLATRWLEVRFPAAVLSSNNLMQVVHTYLPLQIAMV